VIGGLFLVQFALGVADNAVLTAPLFGEGGYLLNAGAMPVQLGVVVILGVVGALLTVAIAVLAFPVLRPGAEGLALAFLALSVIAAALSCVEHAGLLAMRQYSLAYLGAEDAQQEALAFVGTAGSLLRNAMHYVGLLLSGAVLMLWYTAMLRFSLLPTLLGALGVVAVALQLFAISQPVLGGEVNFMFLAPLAFSQLLMSLWLLWRGFPEPGVR
jgi:hypothetical protein